MHSSQLALLVILTVVNFAPLYALKCSTDSSAEICSYDCCVGTKCGSISDCGATGQVIAIVVLSTVAFMAILVFLAIAFIRWDSLKQSLRTPQRSAKRNNPNVGVQLGATSFSQNQSSQYLDHGLSLGGNGSNYYNDYPADTYQSHSEY